MLYYGHTLISERYTIWHYFDDTMFPLPTHYTVLNTILKYINFEKLVEGH